MQHHGMPTRLLDWTTNFAVALYFALNTATESCAIWLLDPHALSRVMVKLHSIFEPEVIVEGRYEDLFIGDHGVTTGHKFPAPVVALNTPRYASRMAAQRGTFTLHKDLETPLEELCPSVLEKLVLSADGFDEARRFLSLAGVNEYSIFPDLDGLARFLVTREYPKQAPS